MQMGATSNLFFPPSSSPSIENAADTGDAHILTSALGHPEHLGYLAIAIRNVFGIYDTIAIAFAVTFLCSISRPAKSRATTTIQSRRS
jgi:hypothetical protein